MILIKYTACNTTSQVTVPDERRCVVAEHAVVVAALSAGFAVVAVVTAAAVPVARVAVGVVEVVVAGAQPAARRQLVTHLVYILTLILKGVWDTFCGFYQRFLQIFRFSHFSVKLFSTFIALLATQSPTN